jgi:hypothetical protein
MQKCCSEEIICTNATQSMRTNQKYSRFEWIQKVGEQFIDRSKTLNQCQEREAISKKDFSFIHIVFYHESYRNTLSRINSQKRFPSTRKWIESPISLKWMILLRRVISCHFNRKHRQFYNISIFRKEFINVSHILELIGQGLCYHCNILVPRAEFFRVIAKHQIYTKPSKFWQRISSIKQWWMKNMIQSLSLV